MTPAAATAEQLETRRRLRAVKVAIGVSVLVCAVEITLGWMLELQSLIAEGIHTLLDGVDSVIVLISVIVAARPADRSHPFGHGKFEALGAAVEGSFVLVAAIGIGFRAVDRLVRHEAPDSIPLFVCGVMIAAAVFYLFVSMYLMRVARETSSPAVLAEALHLRTHIFITAGVAGGLLLGSLARWPIADTFLALGIAVCLVGISVHIFREVLKQFMDEALPSEEIERLADIIARYSDRFVEVHGLRTRQSGAERHIAMHLVVLPQTTVSAAHGLSHEIEDAITTEWPAARVTVHVEPVNTDHTEYRQWIRGQPKVRTGDDPLDQREFMH
ncbi:MAG: cation diffusion facilitator family transporter [Phycisphaerae bacterium]